MYGEDSSPASDPPSTWWVESSKTAGTAENVPANDDGDSLRRAADELLIRGRAGLGMTGTTARYRQFELAQLLGAVERAVEIDQTLPPELLRHAANLAQHINNNPAAPTGRDTRPADEAAVATPRAEDPPSPGGVPSHVSVQTPGSIHEGGELGYALAHAAGAAFDLLVACVVGDGEAETGPLAASWKIPAFLNARRDGAVRCILHLNGYKISGPTVLGRASDADVVGLLAAQGWDPVVVSGDNPSEVFSDLHRALFRAHTRIRSIQEAARAEDAPTPTGPARWPAIILRTPKGWTGPDVVDGVQIQGTSRAQQVPLSQVRENPGHLRLLESGLRSYAPETLFDAAGRLVPELAALAPDGDKRMSATPYANGGRLLRPLDIPRWSASRCPWRSAARWFTRTPARLVSSCGTCTRPRPAPAMEAAISACSVRTRQPATGWPRSSRSPTGACRSPCCRPMITCHRTAA